MPTESGQRDLPLPTTEEMFAKLGGQNYFGHGFAITVRCIEDEFGGSVERFMAACPKPDYEHVIYRDDITYNILIVRPNKAGQYVWQDGTPMVFKNRLR